LRQVAKRPELTAMRAASPARTQCDAVPIRITIE